MNLTYALLAERADSQDQVELLFSPNVAEKDRKTMVRNRQELDTWLYSASGQQAVAEQVLLKELGGAA